MGNLNEQGMELLGQYGPGILGAVLVLGWFVARLVTRLVRRLMARAAVDPTLTGFTANMVYMVYMVLVVISALGQLGVNTTSFAAIVGAAALAIGFALQGSLANFAAGVMLILFRPFKTGDCIEAGGTSGVVEEVQVFATKIRTPDNKQITIPNGAITDGWPPPLVPGAASPSLRLALAVVPGTACRRAAIRTRSLRCSALSRSCGRHPGRARSLPRRPSS